MKRSFYISIIALATAFIFTACEYDDADIKSDLADLDSRIDELESLADDLQEEVTTLQTLVSAVQTGDWITSVSDLSDNGRTGWLITFNSYGSITIYDGEDGDAYTPVISVKLVDGVYYWTVDGELAYDSNGNPMPVSPTDGSTGVTPQLKIGNDGAWYYSLDGGSTWIYLAEADWGYEAGDSYLFNDVEYDDDYVYFYLNDGTTFTVARGYEFSITLDSQSVTIDPGDTATVAYTVTGYDENTVVRVYYSDGYHAYVTATDASSGTITIVAPESDGADTNIMVFVSDGDQKFAATDIAVTYNEQEPLYCEWTFSSTTYSDGDFSTWITEKGATLDAGDGGAYAASNVSGDGMIYYVSVDKNDLDTNSNFYRGVNSSGYIFIQGAWTDDYWLITAQNGVEYPAGTQFYVAFNLIITKYCPKYWMLEYWDGEEWQPATDTSTASSTIEDDVTVTYNCTPTTAQSGTQVKVYYTLAKACTLQQFRLRCAYHEIYSGITQDYVMAGTIRFYKKSSVGVIFQVVTE